MAKKLLCVVLSIVMVLGTFAVAVNAAGEDYKKLIDTQFLFAYGPNDAGPFDEAQAQYILNNYWKDEIITAYNAAETAADWEALYNKMCTPHDWRTEESFSDEFKNQFPPEDTGLAWPEYREVRSGNHKVTIRYVADKAYAMPGDTVTISCYVTTNFYAWTMDCGLFYDRGKVQYVSTSFDPTDDSKLDNWVLNNITNDWGIITSNGWDYRDKYWPLSMRDNQNNCYETREAVYHSIIPDFVSGKVCGTGENDYRNPMFDDTYMWTAQFTVTDEAQIGDVLTFAATEDSGSILEDFENCVTVWENTLLKTFPVPSEIDMREIDFVGNFDVDYIIAEEAIVTVGEEPVSAYYDELDAAIAEMDDLNAADYYNWADYAAAVEAGKAVSRDLTENDQAIIDAATKAITDAKAALKGFADYDKLDDAIAEMVALTQSDYTAASWAAYAAAVEAGTKLDRALSEDDQAIVDNATQAIKDAKAALKNFADYDELDDAIADMKNLNAADYYNWADYAAAVEAGKAIARDLSEDDQAIVDNAKQAILDAKAALKNFADYDELDDAIADKDNLNADEYTADTWNAYAAAVEAGTKLDRALSEDDQAIVNAATKAITDAKAALVKNSIASVVAPEVELNTDATVTIEVTGSPDMIRFVDTQGAATTYTRDDAEIAQTDAGEIWTVGIYVTETNPKYKVYAIYGEFIVESDLTIRTEAEDGLDLGVYSIEIPDMYPDKQNGGTILAGKHDVIIRTGKDVHKIQFMTAGGGTYTYAPWYTTVVEEGDQLVWTISHSFGPYGDWSLDIRTRATTTTFADTNMDLVATVLY